MAFDLFGCWRNESDNGSSDCKLLSLSIPSTRSYLSTLAAYFCKFSQFHPGFPSLSKSEIVFTYQLPLNLLFRRLTIDLVSGGFRPSEEVNGGAASKHAPTAMKIKSACTQEQDMYTPFKQILFTITVFLWYL